MGNMTNVANITYNKPLFRASFFPPANSRNRFVHLKNLVMCLDETYVRLTLGLRLNLLEFFFK